MKRAVIYCRVSTKEQVGNFSLDTQEDGCRRYCRQNGIEVDRVFIEEGESAKTARRTEFQKAIEYCRKNRKRVTHFIVYRIDRFARSQQDHYAVRGMLKKYGVTLRSFTEPIDDSPYGRAMEGMSAVWSQLDNDIRSVRTTEGMKAALRKGRWTFQAPLGYMKNPDDSGPCLLPDPERAGFIRQAFEWYVSGRFTKKEITRRLNDAGFRTPKGARISAQTLDKILANPIYAGWMEVKNWDLRVRGDFEPLISEDLFRRANPGGALSETARAARQRLNPDFPLKPTVLCHRCGRPLTGSSPRGRRRRYSYYHCHRCRGVNHRKEVVEGRFESHLGTLSPSAGIMRAFRAAVRDRWRERQKETAHTGRRLEQRVADLETKKDRLVDLLLEGKIDQATYNGQSRRIDDEIDGARRERAHVMESPEMDVEGILGFAERLLPRSGEAWRRMDAGQRQMFQNALFPTGVPFDGENFGTARTSWIFKALQGSEAGESKVASLRGLELN